MAFVEARVLRGLLNLCMRPALLQALLCLPGSANAEGDVQKEQDLKAAMPYRKGSISLLQSQEPESPWQGVRSEVPPVNSCRFEPQSTRLLPYLSFDFILLLEGTRAGKVLASLKPKASLFFISGRPRFPSLS